MEVMEKQELGILFAKASKLDKDIYQTPEDWGSMRQMNGVKRFKRRVLGLCGRQSVKSLDEMAQILHQIGIASSEEEGRTIVPTLDGAKLSYTADKEISIAEVENVHGQKAYRIKYFNYSDCGLA